MARRSGGLRVYLWGGLGLIAAAIVAGYVVHGRYADIAAARDTLDASAARGPVVQVVSVASSPSVRDIRLLGDARAYASATLFSKVSGYLKSISVDKGDKVKAGDKLAEISSAETDALYDAAVADLDNKRRLAQRDKDLLTRGNVAVQAAQTSDTNLRMAEQSVKNLATMKGYETIIAPFDGVVTARFADPGALVQSAATAQSSALPIVTLSDNSKLRITAYVEQRDVPYVHVGDAATITDASDRSRSVTTKIARTSGALDPKTRTLLIEMDVDNSQNFLVPGSFVYATLHLNVPSAPQIPVGALILRGNDNFVAAVDDNGVVSFRKVRIGDSDGANVSIVDGVKTGDKIAVNVPDAVGDGSHIQAALASK
ncbi:MAG TPA: efflux RND transporter periplasmic adaptor subunit [Stellaceae bacterium]|nr:efflux RND transporter periplasmic adaptor subunit [Stellaceae bacterium]